MHLHLETGWVDKRVGWDLKPVSVSETSPLTKANLCGLIHHGHLDHIPIWEHKRQILGVGEHELLLPDTLEGHCVDQGHLRPVSPPKSLCLGLARAWQLTADASCQEMPWLIWNAQRKVNVQTTWPTGHVADNTICRNVWKWVRNSCFFS